MGSSFENVSLLIPRGHSVSPPKLREPLVVKTPVPLAGPNALPPNHVLLKVDKFGFSSNNVTYGALGEVQHYRYVVNQLASLMGFCNLIHLIPRYFEFHPAPKTATTSPESHGIIPVWGFATVILSSIDSIKPGERVYGYLGMSKYILVPVDPRSINIHNFYVPRPHLPADRRPYNQLMRCAADPQYRTDREDETMLYRPLFWTSYWCEDWLNVASYRDATHVIISSASSKTSFCLAYVIKQRRSRENKNLTIIGLTSDRNVPFTQNLNLYDQIVSYNDITQLESKSHKYLYIDVASNSSLNSKLFSHLQSSLLVTVVLGMTNFDDAHGKSPIAGNPVTQTKQKIESFFMPEWLVVRRRQLSVPQITNMQNEAWKRLMGDCKGWVKMEYTRGGEKVKEKFLATVNSQVGPDKGLVFSFWEEDELQRAKL